jgi:hypothetical protein
VRSDGRLPSAQRAPDGELFVVSALDLRAPPLGRHPDAKLSAAIGRIWRAREDRYSAPRTTETVPPPKL